MKRTRARRGDGDKLRDEIVNAAEALLARTRNVDDVSIRAVADAVGVTPPSIYLHFADKDDLIFAVCERNFADLDSYTASAATGVDDPLEALKAIGAAYVRFALDRPEMYRFLFMERAPERYDQRLVERIQGLSAFERVLEVVARCIDAGVFAADDDPAHLAALLWASAHGFASLRIAQPWFPWPEIDASLDRYLRAVATGLGRT